MRLPLWQVDAFTSARFRGNPAAVCLLDAWLEDDVLQAVASENNLSETAYLVRSAKEAGFEIRWFTPVCEVDLCGHATLASAWVVLTHVEPDASAVTFRSRSGPLTVTRDGDHLVLDFPARPAGPLPVTDALAQAMGEEPVSSFASTRDWLLVYDSERDVRALSPAFDLLAEAAAQGGVIATAPGDDCDFVSRFFAPAVGVDEDPVTGSAHCVLVPYWSRRLGRTTLRARQVSARGGELHCEDAGTRVRIGGRVVPYLEGTILV